MRVTHKTLGKTVGTTAGLEVYIVDREYFDEIGEGLLVAAPGCVQQIRGRKEVLSFWVTADDLVPLQGRV